MSEYPFGLRENPFAAGHDPRRIHSDPERHEILARVGRAVDEGEPFILITGEAGVGKSSVVSEALARPRPRVRAAVLSDPSLSRAELLEAVALRFGIELPGASSRPQIMLQLERFLSEVRDRDERAVLVVDEAHALDPDLLEEIRLLSNLEASGRAQLTVVLAGLPAFEENLARPELEPLRQRIAVHCRIHPLSAAETREYLRHRMAAAGYRGTERFSPEACSEIHALSRGVPREINTLAGHALRRAGRAAQSVVGRSHVREAAADRASDTARPAPPAPSPEATPRARAQPEKHSQKTRRSATQHSKATPSSPSGTESRPEDPARAGADVKAWVSRFAGDGPPRIGSQVGSQAYDLDHGIPEPHAGSRAVAAGEPWPETESPGIPPLPAPTSGPETTRSPHRTRVFGSASALAFAAVVVFVGAVVMLLLPRAKRTGPAAIERPQDASSPGPAPAGTSPAAPIPSPPAIVADPAPGPTLASDKSSDHGLSAATAADSIGHAPPARRFGIVVATYISADRAAEERDRLATTTGLRARLRRAREDGAIVHRVVLGSFDGPASAERVADDLLARGLIGQARIIHVAGPSGSR